MAEKKFYAYHLSETGEQGVTETWAACEKKVKGVAGSRFKGFKRREDAEAWLAFGAEYGVKAEMPPGVYFDAGTGRGDGVEVRVTDEKGKDLLHEVLGPRFLTKHHTHRLWEGTNNVGELLGCKFALEVAQKLGIQNIYGDSKLIIEYWSRGYIKAGELPPETVALAREVAALRKAFEAGGGTIERVSGDDNPADLGFH